MADNLRVIQAALTFLSRVEIKGSEAPVFMEVIALLTSIANKADSPDGLSDAAQKIVQNDTLDRRPGQEIII